MIEESKLVEKFIDLETQLTGNGFDLTVANIFEFEGAGKLDFSNKERLLPQGRELPPQKENSQDRFGWWNLAKGVYKIRTNEAVNLPNDLVALAFTRTSLLRMGVFTQHGVWDAGFSGRGEFVLVVANESGVMLKQNARVAQLVFLGINETTHGYQGIYKNI